MSGRLKGKVAVIVGAGQQPGTTIGNGRAVAIRFAQEGATCLLVDKVGAWADDTCNLLEGAPASSFEADVTSEGACRAVIEAAVTRFGRVDILHNNIGMSKGDKPTSELDVEAWDRIMSLNLKSMFMLCKHALPVMREQRSGSIINISSTSSLSKRATLAYKTSKGAINTLTQHVAAENAAYGVRANVIVPGLIDTPMAIERRAEETGRSRDEIRAERNALVPMGFMGAAWDVANAAVYLASDEARYVTGVLLPVDGGLLLKRG
jgi:NAD(P)-dependent dehydrogenase (short-subunit alcohol dehydrogenase family)